MVFDVDLKLVVFAINKPNRMNTYVLLDSDLNIPDVHISKAGMLASSTDVLKGIFGIVGNWIESTPNQIGVFEDMVANKLSVIYSLLMPTKIDIYRKDQFSWHTLDSLTNVGCDKMTDAVINFAIKRDGQYV